MAGRDADQQRFELHGRRRHVREAIRKPHQQKKYREPHRHDWQQRVRCVLRHILRPEKAELMPQGRRLRGSFVGGIDGDSRRYDSSPETWESLDFSTAGRAAAWEEAAWTSPLRAICQRL